MQVAPSTRWICVAMDNPQMWGGCVTLANGWRLELPMMSADTVLPITVDARRLIEGATGSSAANIPPFDPVGE